MIKESLFALLFVAPTAFAQNLYYFGSVKASKTTIEDNDIVFDHISNHLTIAPLTTAGVSVDANLSDKFQVLSQFILKNEKYIGVDLLQMRYFVQEGFLLRVGKQRLPTNLHSENIQVQALLPWMTAPREIYSRNPIYSFTGLSAEKSLGPNFGLHIYAGDTKDEFITESAEYVAQTENVLGLRLNFKKSAFEAFANYFQADGNLKITVPADLDGTGPGQVYGDFVKSYRLEKIQGATAGLQYRPKEFFLLSEYSLLASKNSLLERVEAASVSLGKEINEKWVPVATFSTDLDVESELSPTKTSTYAFNLNYRLDYSNVFKIGFEHINYKERTVNTALGPVNSSVFTNGSPGENFDIYSLMWAFVY